MDVSSTPMFIKAVSPPVKAGTNARGSPRALRSSSGSECARGAASPIIFRLRTFVGVAGGDGDDGASTVGDDDEAAMACDGARAVGLTADNLKV